MGNPSLKRPCIYAYNFRKWFAIMVSPLVASQCVSHYYNVPGWRILSRRWCWRRQQHFKFDGASRRKPQQHHQAQQSLKASSFITSRVMLVAAAAAAAAATTAGFFFGEEEKEKMLSMNSTGICYCDTFTTSTNSSSDKEEDNEDFDSLLNNYQHQLNVLITAGNQQQSQQQQQQDHDVMVDEYVKSLMKDQELVILPLGMGKSSPKLMDFFGLNRALVVEAISYFQSTVRSWNMPSDQGHIVGHPIVYRYYTYYNRNMKEDQQEEGDDENGIDPSAASSSSSIRKPYYHLVHNPAFALPDEFLSVVADTLLEDPRIAPNIFPKRFERLVLMNTLHVLTCILMDLVLSSSISLNNGVFQMTWTYDEKKQQQYVQYLISSNTLQKQVKDALQQIDFDVVEEQASNAVKDQQMVFYGEESLYGMAYKIMLVMFYMFSNDAECRFIGTSVKQTFVKPPPKKIVDDE